jgi:inward rectifier potassium channel
VSLIPNLNFSAVFTPMGMAKLGQIIIGDLTMAGDNVVIMGSLASGLPERQRRQVLMLGVGMALAFLIIFAVLATQLLKITGLVFARFARPTAKIIFSDVAVIAPYRGIEGLMFRMVNGRSSQLIEVNIQVLFARFVNENGRSVRRFTTLDLERKNVTFMPLALTVVHPIGENSPFKGLSQEDLIATDAELLILITAIDETFAQTVHTRSSYKPEDFRCGYKFASIYNEVADGEPISINIRKLSKIERVEPVHSIAAHN